MAGNASKYWASLEFDDAKGKTHRKEIARELQRHEIKQYAAGVD